jgi:hypothetical protein
MFDSMLGLKLVTVDCLPLFVRWKRTHRNNRIAKKWRKYGMVTRCEHREKAYRIGWTIYACRCGMAAIRKQLEAGR